MALNFFNVVRMQIRAFNTSGVLKCVPSKPSGDSSEGIRKMTTLTGLQKWALVFTGKYKTKEEIPKYVSYEVLERARSRARIKLSNYLMVLTMLGCLGYAYNGRQASGRGESVSKMNMEWHKEYNEQVAKEKAKNM